MKKIGIAVTEPDDWTGKALFSAVRYYGMDAVRFSFNNAASVISSGKLYSDRIDLTALDAIVVRDMGPAWQNDAAFRFDILCQLEELGIKIVNPPDSIALCANKYASSYLFKKYGIATPETIVTNNFYEAMDALSSFERAVVKPIFGYKGIGVECVKNSEEGLKKISDLLEKNGLIYMQEFIPNPGRDIRVFIVDNKIAGSIYRIAPAGSWINNLSQGASAKKCVLTDEQEKLALKAAGVSGAIYSGVDIIEGDRDYVIEINGTPSGKGIFEASGIDVTIKIAQYLERKLRSFIPAQIPDL